MENALANTANTVICVKVDCNAFNSALKQICLISISRSLWQIPTCAHLRQAQLKIETNQCQTLTPDYLIQCALEDFCITGQADSVQRCIQTERLLCLIDFNIGPSHVVHTLCYLSNWLGYIRKWSA